LSKLKLSEISNPISKELADFSNHFNQSMKSDVFLVDMVAKYILKQKGKKVRPLLVFLSGELCGGINERSFRGATLVELLHTATLVHDDVVDSAEERRGLPSINAVWKNKVAVLMGDYLLSKGLMLAVDGEDFDFLKVITTAVKRMSEGELNQIGKTKKLDIDESAYYRIISDKTASLLSTCCEIGARGSTKNEEMISAMKNFGENLGIAFQIRDDILDYIGTSRVIGKPLGGDIKEKKITLPLIYSLGKAEKKEADKIKKFIKQSRKSGNVKDVINFVHKYNGIAYAEKSAGKYADKAKEYLNIFEDSEVKQALLSLTDFVTNRKN